MRKLTLAALLCIYLPTELLGIQVVVPYTEYRTTLFASVIMRCDYSTSANIQDVLVTWKFKSFCKDPVLDYFSAAYQAQLAMGQDPSNDCPDSQRTIRIVIQKKGTSEPILGTDYRERKITIQNKADLVITEIMWWDNGVYFCAIDASGDTSGDSDKEVKLIVYSWLVVLLIILGALLLFLLFGICCCQCCPQVCCCYVRCPCCPRTCCCPERLVMQHRMMKDAQKGMFPWMYGQPGYAPVSNASSQIHPALYADPSKHGFPMGPLPLPPPQPLHPSLPPSIHGNSSIKDNKRTLDYLENQVRGLDMSTPMMVPPPLPVHQLPLQFMPPPPVHMPQGIPFSAGPPSMLSSLNEVPTVERRVIQLPPIVERPGSNTRRPGSAPRGSRPSSRLSGASGRRDRPGPSVREPSLPLRGILRSYSDESDMEDRQRGSRSGRQSRSRSRDDIFEEPRRGPGRRQRSLSPKPRRDSWSSDDDYISKKGAARSRRGNWSEKPPSYSSIDIESGRRFYTGPKANDRFSDKSSRSGTSVVI